MLLSSNKVLTASSSAITNSLKSRLISIRFSLLISILQFLLLDHAVIFSKPSQCDMEMDSINKKNINSMNNIAIEKSSINYSNDDDDGLNTEKLDPLKKMNILAFYFNGVADYLVLRHIARGYQKLTSEDFKCGVQNVLDTYKTPISSFNSILQGKFDESAIHFWRFAINFTFGGFGINDMATKLGLPKLKHRNFGSTLAYYGAGPGIYLVLPIYGQTTARDMLDVLFLNKNTNFINNEIPNSVQLSLNLANMVHSRYLIMKHADTLSYSIPDIYVFARDMFLIRRESEMEYPDYSLYKKLRDAKKL